MSIDRFSRITTCKYAKKTWNILAVTHESISIVTLSKLQMFTTKFENMKINKDKSFSEFSTKLNDIVSVFFLKIFYESGLS